MCDSMTATLAWRGLSVTLVHRDHFRTPRSMDFAFTLELVPRNAGSQIAKVDVEAELVDGARIHLGPQFLAVGPVQDDAGPASDQRRATSERVRRGSHRECDEKGVWSSLPTP